MPKALNRHACNAVSVATCGGTHLALAHRVIISFSRVSQKMFREMLKLWMSFRDVSRDMGIMELFLLGMPRGIVRCPILPYGFPILPYNSLSCPMVFLHVPIIPYHSLCLSYNSLRFTFKNGPNKRIGTPLIREKLPRNYFCSPWRTVDGWDYEAFSRISRGISKLWMSF